MKRIFSIVRSHWLVITLFTVVFLAIFWPIFLKGQIPMSANLLGSFFNPWAQEKFIGWEQGIPNKPTGIDDLRIFYPQKHFTISSFFSGQIPFWNPYNYSGNYHAGLSETAVFYPLFFVFIFLPQSIAWTLLIILEPLLAGLGMYLYLKHFFSDKKIAAFGALVFAFSGIVMVRSVEGLSVGHTLVWLPFAFYAVEGFFTEKKLRYLIITLIAFCFSILAGWFQFTFYIIAFSFIYCLYRLVTTKFSKRVFLIFLPFFLAPFFTLFHIIPALESLLTSPRGTQSIAQILQLHLMPVTHIFTFIFPDLWGNPGTYTFFGKSEYKESILYIGVIPFILSLFSIEKVKNKFVLFFAITGIVSLFLGLDTSITNTILHLPIPIISTFLPNRIFLITTFSFSVLAAFGLSALLKKVSVKTIAIVLTTVLLLVGCVDGYIFISGGFTFLSKFSLLDSFRNQFNFLVSLQLSQGNSQLQIISRSVIFPQILIVFFVIGFFISLVLKKKTILLFFVVVLTVIGQVYFATRYIPFSNPTFMYPKHPVFSYLQKTAGINRFISTNDAYISSEIPLFYNLYSPDGVGSMYIARYGELVKYMQSQGKSYTDIPRIETRIDPSSDNVFANNDPYLTKFMQIDGIKYIVTLKKNAIKPTSEFSLVWENNTWQIYVFHNVLPRFFLTNSFLVDKNQSSELKKIFDPENSPSTILLEEDPQISSESSHEGGVQILTYQPNYIKVRSFSTNDSLLYMSDTFSPNFIALVDSKPVKILRANYAFRAIVVPKGKHTITMEYKDFKEISAGIIAGFTLVSSILFLLVLKTKKFST